MIDLEKIAVALSRLSDASSGTDVWDVKHNSGLTPEEQAFIDALEGLIDRRVANALLESQ